MKLTTEGTLRVSVITSPKMYKINITTRLFFDLFQQGLFDC